MSFSKESPANQLTPNQHLVHTQSTLLKDNAYYFSKKYIIKLQTVLMKSQQLGLSYRSAMQCNLN